MKQTKQFRIEGQEFLKDTKTIDCQFIVPASPLQRQRAKTLQWGMNSTDGRQSQQCATWATQTEMKKINQTFPGNKVFLWDDNKGTATSAHAKNLLAKDQPHHLWLGWVESVRINTLGKWLHDPGSSLQVRLKTRHGDSHNTHNWPWRTHMTQMTLVKFTNKHLWSDAQWSRLLSEGWFQVY